ncbi:two-partner secretion domain-containing protein [Pseudomonas nicosulfuronedens]
MDIRHPACKLLASALSGLLILNPLVAAAADLAVDAAAGGNTTIGAAGNGVPVVNIATPNGAGLSHNKFSDYNVGPSGLILNNATDKTQLTERGGMIIGNPNLRGQAAQKILNEVTGANPSQLRGYTEVAGQSAHVIVANPHGVTCDGCGFINTPRVTLTTGKPILDAGRLLGYDVNGGEIAIEGKGLNGLDQDKFELIARATKLNAELHANQLTVIAGRNLVDAETLAATAKADDGSAKPQLAIDSSALGGMYSNTIRLVGTEYGVGVKLSGNMAASAGDIQIDANGQLSLARAAASGSLRAKAPDISVNGPAYAAGNVELAANGTLSNQGQLAAGSRVQLSAAQIGNSGIVEAGVNPDNSRNGQGDVALTAQTVRNSGSVVASRNLDINTSGTLDNQRGASLRGVNSTLTTSALTNQGRALASNQLTIAGQQLSNFGGEMSAQLIQVQGAYLDNRLGLFSAEQALNLTLGNLDNSQQGSLSSGGTLSAQVSGALNNRQGGRIVSGSAQQLRAGQLNNQGDGLISSRGDLAVQADHLDNRGGRIVGDTAVSLNGGSLDNRDSGRVIAGQALQLALDSVSNAGTIHSDTTLTLNARTVSNASGGQIAAKGGLSVQAERFEQNGGQLLSEAALQVVAQQLINRQGGWMGALTGLDLRVGELFNQGAEISSRSAMTIVAQQLDNSAGRIASDGTLQVRSDHLVNQAGKLIGQASVNLRGGSLDNRQGQVSSQGNVEVTLSGALDNHDRGQVISEGTLNVVVAEVDNRAGTLSSAQALNVSANAVNNQAGKLLTDASLNVIAATLDNRQGGVLSAKGVIDLRGATLLNAQAGRILSGADLLLAYTRVDNSEKGRLEAARRVVGQVKVLDQHDGGQLVSPSGIDLDFAGGSLDNSAGGLLSSPGPLRLRNLAQLNNSAGGEISSQQSFLLTLAGLNNRGGRIVSADELSVQVLGGVIDNSLAGVLFAKNQLSLQAGRLDNSAGGTVASQGAIEATLAGQLDNHSDGALAAGTTLDVRSASLNNQGGSLSSGKDLHLVSGALNNQSGRVTAQERLDATATDLDNQRGVISGQQSLLLKTANIDNRAGVITTQGALELSARRVDNRQKGELSAGGELTLRITQLIQQQGRLITGGDLTLDLAGGDLDNRDAVLSVGGLLRIDNLRHLDNRGGEIASENSFQLKAVSLDNGDGGRIISAQHLTLNSGALRNANQGLLSGWQSLLVNAADLDNSGGGTLSSKLGTLDITLSGALDNHDQGALVSLAKQTVTAASLNNQGGFVSGEQDLTLSITGTLDNGAGGVISAQQQLTLDQSATELLNQGGQIGAANLDLTARRLDNSGGRLASQGALNLHLLGELLNVGAGSAIASGGRLDLRAASILNQGGQIASQGLLEILAGRFDNSLGGTLAAQNDLSLDLSGALLNDQDGLIFSKAGQLAISAASVSNLRGTLQAQGDTTLKTTGALDNQGGRLISQSGAVDVNSASVDNSAGGILASLSGALKLVTGWFSNNAGTTQAQSLDITASAGLDNRNGHLSAVSGDNRISTATLDNQGGGLYAGQTLTVSGEQLLNQGAALGEGGRIGAATIDFGLAGALNNRFGLIESSTVLNLSAASLDNVVGAIRALGQSGAMQIQIAGLLNNNLGRIETATTDLRLHSGSLQNGLGSVLHVGSGAFELDLAQAGQAGGHFVSNGTLSYQAASLTNTSSIQARHLNLELGQLTQSADGRLLASDSFTGRGGNWSNAGLLASDGSLDIQLTGSYGGAGRVTSLGDLNLSANQLDISQGASVTGGQNVTLGAGTLNNHGRITAANSLTANTGVLNNYGTFGSAGQLRINTWDLLNDGQANGALIFSGDDMTLRVGGSLTNRFADLYSLGQLDLAANDAGGRTARLDNLSANIESLGDMRLNVGALNNQRVVLVISQDGKYTAQIVEVNCYKYFNDDILDCSGKRNGVWEITERDRLQVTQASAASTISAGGDLRLNLDQLNNFSSQIATGQNLYADVRSLTNQGVVASETETFGVYISERSSNLSSWQREAKAFTDRYWIDSPNYQADNLGGLEAALSHFKGTTYGERPELHRVSQLDSGDQTYAAIIQAGGDIHLNASERLDNSVIRNHTTYVSPGQKTVDTATGDSPVSTVVTINSQLPPDLAQQQVNPISLPGFSLPTGSNGLFRLSGQEGTQSGAQTIDVGSSYSFAGQSITLAQRERSLDADGRVMAGVEVEAGAAAQASSGGASFSVAQVQGVPSSARPDNSHKYLIETNPELTSLKSFLSSDYLLGLLGYDPDKSQKRLGDGLYEQRLIRDAVVARTGQRYLAGINDDENLFKYLMDNAIAYKELVHLQLGVALSAEQVAALTHDLVWLEEATVNGEKVLVPVLYLAQADNRLGPNGALIQGQNLNLISGGDLANQGTLRASGDLAATAANLSNAGLIEAAGRLDLLVLNDLKNTQGGIIKGRDVSLTALTGDILNDRPITRIDSTQGNRTWTESYADNAARIESAGQLDINAGRDINNRGGVIRADGDANLQAGRDINLHSTELERSQTDGRNYHQKTTQLSGDLSAGRDLQIDAGRDISAIATHIEAGRDLAASAGRDVVLASAADEEHSFSQNKKITAQEDHVSQQSTTVKAGGDVLIAAGDDITLISSKISAGNEAYLVAGDKIEVLAANDSDYSLYDKKDKGSWGQKKTKRDEVTDVKAVGSEISAGSDITMLSGGDQTYQAAKLDSGGDIAIVSGGAVTFEAVKDQHQESHEKSDKDLSWQSSKGKGSTDETLRQTQMSAQGELAIKAVDGLKIDYKHLDQKSVGEAIDAMVKADPNLAWLKDAQARGDVDWRAVQELHDSYSYSQSGMGPATQLAVAIAAAAIGGWAAAGSLSGAGVAGGSFAMGAGVGAAGSLASSTAVNLINNKGNLGQTFSDTLTNDNLKQIAIASLVGGLTTAYFDQVLQTKTDPVTGKVTVDLSSVDGASRFAANQAAQNITSAALSKTMGQGGSFGDALKDSVYNTFAAAGFNAIGDFGKANGLNTGDAQMVVMHALMGGLAAEARGDSFAAGAAGAGLNEALVADLDKLVNGYSPETREAMLTMSSQLVGLIGAVAQDSNASASQLETGAWAAKNSTQYNFLNHQDVKDLEQALKDCKPQGTCDQVKAEFRQRDAENSARLTACTTDCAAIREELDGGSKALKVLWESDNTGITDEFMRNNINEWSSAGPRVATQVGTAAWNGQSDALSQIGWYLDQQSFNPFSFNPAGLMGLGADGKSTSKTLMDALKAGELPKGEATPGKTASSMAGMADAEAGMPYNHPTKAASMPSPRQAGNLVGGPLEQAVQVSGRFKLDGGPVNGTVYRADNQGNITSYAVYDSAGMIVKRVDVTGAAHANIPTPHVIEYGRNKLPDGSVRVQSPSTKLVPRPAKSDEMP